MGRLQAWRWTQTWDSRWKSAFPYPEMTSDTFLQQSTRARFVALGKGIEHIPRERAKGGHHRRVEVAPNPSFQNLHGGIETKLSLVGSLGAEGIEHIGKREHTG